MMGLEKPQDNRNNPQNREDADLVRAVALGEPEAERILVDRLFDPIRRITSYLCKDKMLAEDMAQNALLRILDVASSFQGTGSLEAWARRIAIRVVTKELEKRSRRDRLMRFWSPKSMPPPEPEQLASLKQVRSRLTILLDTLPVKQRTATVLRFVEGYSLAEMADAMNVPENTARECLRLGKKKLQNMIKNDNDLKHWVQTRSK